MSCFSEGSDCSFLTSNSGVEARSDREGKATWEPFAVPGTVVEDIETSLRTGKERGNDYWCRESFGLDRLNCSIHTPDCLCAG
jgi:hypothetical protein